MSRAAIILATIFTTILPFSSLSLAASDAEIESFGDKMSAAFGCSTYAHLSQDQKEQQRLFQIGLKAGRDYVEGLKSRDDLAKGETAAFIRSVSTDFVVGQMYERLSWRHALRIFISSSRLRPSPPNQCFRLPRAQESGQLEDLLAQARQPRPRNATGDEASNWIIPSPLFVSGDEWRESV